MSIDNIDISAIYDEFKDFKDRNRNNKKNNNQVEKNFKQSLNSKIENKIERQHAIALFAYCILNTDANIEKGEITVNESSQRDYLISLLERVNYVQLTSPDNIIYYDTFKRLFNDIAQELLTTNADQLSKAKIYDPAECLIVLGDYHNIWKINHEKSQTLLGILSVTLFNS